MRQVKILSGVSGSGKSTLTLEFILSYMSGLGMTAEEMVSAPMPSATVSLCSADSFFEKDGVYTFDASKLSDAHGKCFRDFITALTSNVELVVVDNTNTTNEEIAPYMLGAQAYGYDAQIITLTPGHTDNWVDYYVRCAERNKHGVGIETIKAQHLRITNRKLPPWWKSEVR